MDSGHHRVGVQTMIVQNFIPSAIEGVGAGLPAIRRPDSRPISCGCTPIYVGAELAREGGLTAGLSLAGVPQSLWEPSLLAMAA
jgi:hypothetical protein